jgi:protocatechuate 3,4-dioxygenase beta subunit
VRLPFIAPAVALVLSQQVIPPRDPGLRPAPPPEQAGTAVIRGRVIASDTGTPIRRATVSLLRAPAAAPPPAAASRGAAGNAPAMASGLPAAMMTRTAIVNGVAAVMTSGLGTGPRSATTDAQGEFAFKALPAGSYRLSASPGTYSAQYLPISFGGKHANGAGSFDPGQTIQLAEGQTFEKAVIALPRGSAIVGRVSDENGDPLARVQVYSVLFPPGSSRGVRTGAFAQTDDLGQFRLYGLVPGEYAIVAEARGNMYVRPDAPPETEEEKIGFMTTFYPGTADEGAAQRVRVRPGGDTSGIEIRMTTGRLFHISGMVTDSQGRTGGRFSGSLSQRTKVGNGATSFGFATDQDGRFQMRNVAPGTYRLTVRQMRAPVMAMTGPATANQPEQGEFASTTVTVNADLDGLMITTSPGVTITGQIVYDSAPPQAASQAQPLRVNAQIGDPDGMGGVPTPPPAVVAPDLTFTMKGLSGDLLLRAGGMDQHLKAVLLGGGEDITDTPHEFKQGDRVTLVLTTRASTVEGNVTDDQGAPSAEAALMLFSEDKASWRSNSLRTRRAGTDANGHYRITGLLPGRYLLIAAPRERLNVPFPDQAFFEALAKEATSLVVGEDEQRQVDVKMSTGAGGL